MPLEVKVISYRGHPPVENLKASFGQDGGTLGRSPDKRNNHLTLPDPENYISRNHASITFENGLYYLTDTSVDGTFIKDRNQRVCGETVPLYDGDRMWIGDYELRVRVVSNGTHESINDIFRFDGQNASGSEMNRSNRIATNLPGKQTGRKNDLDWGLDRDHFEKGADPSPSVDRPAESPLQDAFSPPDIVEDRPQPQALPEDFNFEQLFDDIDKPHGKRTATATVSAPDANMDPGMPENEFKVDFFNPADDLPASTITPQTDRASAAEKSLDAPSATDLATAAQFRDLFQRELFQIFLNAAGINEPAFPEQVNLPESMASLGAAFREMVKGLMAILRGRTELKTQLRVEATSIKPTDNNPLKFFREVDAALKQVLVSDQPGFVDASSAVREGFTDIMNHQMAMHAGVQAALIDLIQRFDPQQFTKPYEEGVVFQKKAKAWDAYQEAYKKIAGEALERFFGKPFADAYEAQIRKLQSKPS